jgi:hypothetical protein
MDVDEDGLINQTYAYAVMEAVWKDFFQNSFISEGKTGEIKKISFI